VAGGSALQERTGPAQDPPRSHRVDGTPSSPLGPVGRQTVQPAQHKTVRMDDDRKRTVRTDGDRLPKDSTARSGRRLLDPLGTPSEDEGRGDEEGRRFAAQRRTASHHETEADQPCDEQLRIGGQLLRQRWNVRKQVKTRREQ
jgi:hypothetical protein